jgi:hypothetical protein
MVARRPCNKRRSDIPLWPTQNGPGRSCRFGDVTAPLRRCGIVFAAVVFRPIEARMARAEAHDINACRRYTGDECSRTLSP